jgi:hypothetical protein
LEFGFLVGFGGGWRGKWEFWGKVSGNLMNDGCWEVFLIKFFYFNLNIL